MPKVTVNVSDANDHGYIVARISGGKQGDQSKERVDGQKQYDLQPGQSLTLHVSDGSGQHEEG